MAIARHVPQIFFAIGLIVNIILIQAIAPPNSSEDAPAIAYKKAQSSHNWAFIISINHCR
ncbi:hypothetical protein [Nostoc sp.]